MNKNRIGWLFTVLIQLILILMLEAYWCVYTLAAQVISAAMLIVIASIMSRNVRIEVEEGKSEDIENHADIEAGRGSADKESKDRFRIKLKNRNGNFPVLISACYHLENLLTGDNWEGKIYFYTGWFSRTFADISVDSRFCGKVELTLSDIRVMDILGLISFAHNERKKASLLLIPETYQVFSQTGKSALLDLDSSIYSTSKAGFDRSEVFSVREYQEGDNISGIHWKLTNKTDTVMVREGSLPIKNSLLILMETCFDYEEKNLRERSQKTVTAIISLSESLLDEGIGHHIGWWDKSLQNMNVFEVERIEDLMGILGILLSARGENGVKTVIERYYEELGAWEFSHVAVVEDEIKGEIKLYK